MVVDPKLLAKISYNQLVQAANIVGVANSRQLSKSDLISAFLNTVESLSEEEQDELDERVVEMYNHIVQTLGLVQSPDPSPITDDEDVSDDDGGKKKIKKNKKEETEEEETEEEETEEEETEEEETEEEETEEKKEKIKKDETIKESEVKASKSKPKTSKGPKKRREVPRYSRIQAFCDAIQAQNTGKISDLIAQANKNYVASGGRSNIKESATTVKKGLQVLACMGMITLDGNDRFRWT